MKSLHRCLPLLVLLLFLSSVMSCRHAGVHDALLRAYMPISTLVAKSALCDHLCAVINAYRDVYRSPFEWLILFCKCDCVDRQRMAVTIGGVLGG